MKELFQKLGFLKNHDEEVEIKKSAKSNTKEVKEKENSKNLNGIVFNSEDKEDVLRGCLFSKEE